MDDEVNEAKIVDKKKPAKKRAGFSYLTKSRYRDYVNLVD